MNTAIHGHEVIKLLIEAQKPLTKKELKEIIFTKYGHLPIFFTCSKANMSTDEIIEFLDKKGKFTHTENKISSDYSKICSH